MRGLGLIIFGEPGIGKTSIAARFPGPVQFFSINETGYADLADVDDIPPGVKNDDIFSVAELIKGVRTSKAKTIVIDGCSGMQQVYFEKACQECYDGDWAKFSAFSNGPRVAVPPLVTEFEILLTQKRNQGHHIVLLGHMKTETKPNSMGPDTLIHTLDMDKAINGVFTKWAQAVLFMALDIEVQKSRQLGTAKAKDSTIRVMHTSTAPGHVAKNRLNLPDIIPLGDSAQTAFDAFWGKIPPVYKQ